MNPYVPLSIDSAIPYPGSTLDFNRGSIAQTTAADVAIIPLLCIWYPDFYAEPALKTILDRRNPKSRKAEMTAVRKAVVQHLRGWPVQIRISAAEVSQPQFLTGGCLCGLLLP